MYIYDHIIMCGRMRQVSVLILERYGRYVPYIIKISFHSLSLSIFCYHCPHCETTSNDIFIEHEMHRA